MRDRFAAGRDGVDDVARDHALRHHILNVHRRRLAGHGDRLFERTDAQIGIDVGGERRRQLDAFTPDRVEARQRERHDVAAGNEIDDLVLTRGVGHDGAHLLDE